MVAFLVGLMVIILMGAISFAGLLLFPLLLVLGFFLRFVVLIFLGLFMIWFIGKVTIFTIESLRKPKPPQLNG
ncbi:MAG: hypothetical protein HYZ84_00770 [Candidatus Omnitrophica bacterium]|nr:hypothetical protein [Candidatus Omnitrophota bacterium]